MFKKVFNLKKNRRMIFKFDEFFFQIKVFMIFEQLLNFGKLNLIYVGL